MQAWRNWWKQKMAMESFKFAFYVALPIGVSAVLLMPGQVNKLVGLVSLNF